MKKMISAFVLMSGIASVSFAISNAPPARLFDSASTVKIRVHGGTRGCTAVIVHKYMLLTAAHCFQDVFESNPKVDITTELNGNGGGLFKIVRWKPVPGYIESDVKPVSHVQYDIAYFVIDQDIVKKFGLNPSQIPRFMKDDAYLETVLNDAESTGVAYGYGDSPGKLSGTKTEADMKVKIAANNALIGKGIVPGTGVCEGDSGGPLFIRNVKERGPLLLAGILSGAAFPKGEGCGAVGTQAHYAELHPHLCWIQFSSKVDLGIDKCQ